MCAGLYVILDSICVGIGRRTPKQESYSALWNTFTANADNFSIFPCNHLVGLPGITTRKLHRPGKEPKSFPEGICRKKQGRQKERKEGREALVHVNKRQAAYEKKTGITRAIMGKQRQPCFQRALLRDQVLLCHSRIEIM